MKKLLSLLLVLVMVITLTAGCSPKQEKVSLELFCHPTLYLETYQAFAKEFTDKNPNITIEVTSAPAPEAVILTRVQNDDVPDMILTFTSEADFKSYAKEGYFMDLTGQPFLKAASDEAIQLLKINGKDYSLPCFYTAVGLYYNTKIFQDNGISEPTTWDELIAAAQTLKDKGITPFEFCDKDDWTHGKLNTPLYANFMTGGGQQFFADLLKGTVKTSTNPEFVKVTDRVLELRQFAQPDSLGTDYGTGIDAFIKGETAMIIMGIWAYEPFVTAGVPFKMIPFPADEPGEALVPFTIDAAFALSAKLTGAKKDAAIKFLNYMVEPDVAKRTVEMRPSPSLLKGVTPSMPFAQTVLDAFANGKMVQWMQNYWPPAVVPEYYKIMQQFVSNQDKTEMYTAVDALFKENGTE